MSKYFIYYFFIPFAVSLFAGMGYSMWINQDYESEWLTAEGNMGFDVFVICMVGLIMFGFTFSIQFNKIRTISKTFVLSFLTWFLFPVSFVFMVVYHKVDRYNLYESCSIKYDAPTFFDESFIMQIIIYSPYLIGAIISFVIFRRDLKRIT